ncbi:MAG: hypothetical protein AAGD11_00895 [Planctomycetota bacterium]
MAVGFTAVLNVLLLGSLVFSEWIPLRLQLGGYGALTAVWVLARWQSRAERRASMAGEAAENDTEAKTEILPAERDTLFREAQGYYLRNDWVATEQLLLKLVKQDGRDVESRLMLATLWRHQGRVAEAKRQLDRLARLEAASCWESEIAAERMAIAQSNDEPIAGEPANRVAETEHDEADHRRAA